MTPVRGTERNAGTLTSSAMAHDPSKRTTLRRVPIRPAREADIPAIAKLIGELATYEKLAHEVVLEQSELLRHLFGPKPYAEVLMAEEGSEPVGFALFFHNFSTFLGKPGVYLEDLFVRPAARGRGVGRQLLIHLARLA